MNTVNRIIHITRRVAWALLFVTLPVTSFPYFPAGLGGKTLVRPLAAYPLIIIVILVTIPRLIKKPLPRTFLPLFAFIVVSLISSTLALSSDIEALRGVTLLSRFIRNIATLALGSAFYLSVSLLHESWDDLKFSLRWLYIGFGIALFWGSLQALYIVHFSPTYFKLLSQLQSLVSTRKLFPTRISGLTYEPKWFAEQICFLLLPWLLGAILSQRSIFHWRFKRVTVEWLLLIWASAVLTFTYSRSGLLILGILLFTSFVAYQFYIPHQAGKGKLKSPKKRWRKALEIMVVVIGLLTAFILIGSQSTYVSRFWSYWTEAKQRRRTYLEFIAVQQRLVYLETALHIYDANPLLGVGLGNYAFYFEEMIPDEPWFRQPEIIRQLTPIEGRTQLITPKNLIARLLAETGLAGTVAFVAFLFAILGCVLYLWFSPTVEQKYWGISGLLGMLVLAFIIFSFDSFAFPKMWVVLGLLTAAAHIPEPVDHLVGTS